MNFSDSKRLRRGLSLVLCLGLVATLFTGCFGSGNSDETTSETSSGLNLNLNTDTTGASTTAPTETEPTEEINENTGVALSSINVRSTPSQDAIITATLAAGDRVEIVRREELLGINWGYITDPVGWVVMDYIQMDMEQDDDAGSDTSTPAGNGETTPTTNNTTTTTNTTSIKGTVTANGLYIRSEASKNGKVQGSYSKGDTVTILETKNGWGRTDKGWISMDYVQTTTGTNNTTTTTTNTNVTGNGSTTVQFKGVVIASELNVRSSASQDSDKVGTYTYGKRVEFYQKDGNWGRTSDGWISLSYVYQDGTTGSKTATGTVTATELRVRSGPGTGYDVVGSYKQGDAITVLEQFTYGNTTWGCTKTGWVSMDYVEVTGSTGTTTTTTTTTTETQQSGTVTADGLRIRSGAGTSYGVVGSYNSGDNIIIYETTTVDGTTWGRTASGWISMAYVNLQ